MKIKTNKYIIFFSSLVVIFLFAYSFMYFPDGYVGTTKKDGVNLGCVCHGGNPTVGVSVFFTGPDSVALGQTVVYKIKVARGPAIKGGFNAASQFGAINIIPGDTTIRKQDGELTHTFAKPFTNDTVSWSFNYTAPNTAMIDTLFATGNSTNNDNSTDNDQWNWSANRNVRVFSPIGIISISTIANDFSISQNFPNPFNPVTQINFSVAKTSEIKIKIYDILGNIVNEPVNQIISAGEYRLDFNGANLSSGSYFYSLIADGKTISTKKMLIIK